MGLKTWVGEHLFHTHKDDEKTLGIQAETTTAPGGAGDTTMAKQDALVPIKAALDLAASTAEDTALSAAFDAGVASVPAGGPVTGFTQDDIDAAVAKATADDQTHIKDLTDKLGLEEAQIAQVKTSAAAALQQALAILGVVPATPAQ